MLRLSSCSTNASASLVRDQRFGTEPFQQRLGLRDVGGLSRRQQERHGTAERVDDGVDLGR
jgi:hypothetical protein